MDELAAWLERNDAAPLWSAPIPGGEVRAYAVRGVVVLVQVWTRAPGAPRESWEAFVPATRSNRVDETLAALDAATARPQG